jgi:hypothetical protein
MGRVPGVASAWDAETQGSGDLQRWTHPRTAVKDVKESSTYQETEEGRPVMASRSGKFERLARKVGSRRLAGWITTHNPKVRARAAATRRRNAALRRRKRR